MSDTATPQTPLQASMQRGDHAQHMIQNLRGLRARVKSIADSLSIEILLEAWHMELEVVNAFDRLSIELRQLKNEVCRCASQPSNPNEQPTTDSLYHQALRNISGLGITMFENIGILLHLSTTVAGHMKKVQLNKNVSAMIEGLHIAVQNADSERGFKELDDGTDNLMSDVDLATRNLHQWIAYHVKEELETIDTVLRGVMNMFRGMRVIVDGEHYG